MTEKTHDHSDSSNDAVIKDHNFTVPTGKSHPMELLMKQKGLTGLLGAGEIVEGVVLEKIGTRLFIDLGARGAGIIYGKEYYAAPDIIKNLNPGDKISAKVVEIDNEDGYIELSLKDAGEERRWIDLKEMQREGRILELPIKEANRGGLILELSGIKGFLPASQLSAKNYPRVGNGDKEKIFEALQKLIGQTTRVKILDIVPAENKLIFTEKELDQQAMREAVAKYKIGEEVEGEITGVVDFGAFMKFDEAASLEGLIHISEIDWTMIEDPRKVLDIGERVRAKIIDIQGGKVSLSLKALKEDPWTRIAQNYHKGDVTGGKVTKFNPFGAFVELGSQNTDGIQGLVHISEFGTEKKMKEQLELGKEYDFKILLIDPQEHRMSLGMIREEVKEEPGPQDMTLSPA